MGQIIALWDEKIDPDDPVNGYTPYSFVPVGHESPVNMSLGRDWSRKESIVSIPGSDSVLDHYARTNSPMDRRDQSFGFRVVTEDLDAAYDLLAAQIAPGIAQRLVYQTDSGGVWYTVGYNAKITQTLVTQNKGGTSYCDFQVSWRIRPDWRQRYSQAADIWGVNDGVWGVNDTVWGLGNSIPLSAYTNNFNLDNTGVAGFNLPTLSDDGPILTITGGSSGFGGTGFNVLDTNGSPLGGILIVNGTARVPDEQNVNQAMYLIVPQVPVNGSMVIDCGRRHFSLNGAPFRPYRPGYQQKYWRVQAGKVNGCSITAIGGSLLFGSTAFLLVDWWKKKA